MSFLNNKKRRARDDKKAWPKPFSCKVGLRKCNAPHCHRRINKCRMPCPFQKVYRMFSKAKGNDTINILD